jgi:hypothetical protein
MSFSDRAGSGFEFTISNGQVSGMERVFGSDTFSLTIPSSASFTVGSNSVTETLTGSRATEVVQFVQDASNTSLYHIGMETLTVTSPTTSYDNGVSFGYAFTISNGAVTGMQESFSYAGNTHTHNLFIAPTATFSMTNTGVTENLVYGNVLETIQFVASSGGLYAVASDSESFIQPGAATTLLSVEPYERAKFTVDASNAISQVQAVLVNGAVQTVTLPAGISFSVLAPGYVLETRTNGSHSSYEVFHDGNGDGIYTAVAHGQGTTVDLVGLQAQITAAVNAVT